MNPSSKPEVFLLLLFPIDYYPELYHLNQCILNSSSVQFSCSVVNSLQHHGLQQNQASLSITKSRSLLKLKSIESVMSSNNLILYHPLRLPPSTFPSIRVFSNEWVFCIRWPKYWSLCFSISPCNEYTGLISFRWTSWISCSPRDSQQSFLQHHSSKASIPWHLAFFIVQLSHSSMTSGKAIIWLDGPSLVNNISAF